MIEDIKKKIDYFLEKETLTYPEESFKEINDLEKEFDTIFNSNDSELDKLKKLKDVIQKMDSIKFRYGGEYEALSILPEFKQIIEEFNNNHNINETKYSNIKNVKIINNIEHESINDINEKTKYELVLNSIKETFEDEKVREFLTDEELYSLYIEYYKLSKDSTRIEKTEKNLNHIMKKVWENTLTDVNEFQNGEEFNFIIHNFYSGQPIEDSLNQMETMRKDRISCSYITSSFIGIYSDKMRRCGLIYPKDSTIIVSGDRDLYTNEYDEGNQIKNREHSSNICSPQYLEKKGIEETKKSGESFDFSSQYDEVLIDFQKKPVSFYIIGYGEKDINVDYNHLKELSQKYGIPLKEIDMMEYREKKGLEPLDDISKKYITSHLLYSYLNINLDGNNNTELLNYCNKVIDQIYNQVSQNFILLKKSNNLSRENMIIKLEEILKENNIDLDINDLKTINI